MSILDLPPHVLDQLDRFPELPDDISHIGAGIWAASVLLQATLERGWAKNELRQAMLTMVAATLAATGDDEQIIAELREALDSYRALDATKQ